MNKIEFKINKNIYQNFKNKSNFIIAIILLDLIIIYEISYKTNNKPNELKYVSDGIFYKGEKILKKKMINNYLSKISDEYKNDKLEERERFNDLYNLADYFNNSIIQSELRKQLLKEISRLKRQTVSRLDTFFLSRNWNFGNSLITINNAIFFCEVIGCHTIKLNQHHLKRRWLIINKIYIEKLNITIMQDSNVNCKKRNILCLYEISWILFYPRIIKPQIRIHLIKKEILSNLPNVNTKSDDLYIHIRGGDIFTSCPVKYYSQPPLCFYEKIIRSNNFKNIYIVSLDTSNVIVNALINKFKYIIYNRNSFEFDISLLCHAYNVVLSVSSFVLSAIKLNDNLSNIWEYDIMRLSEKFLFLHHHLYNYNIKYKIYTMKPSDIYASKMFVWRKTPEQIKLMFEDDCPNEFIITKPNNF